MSTFTLPSGQGHHFKDKAFKRSFLFSFGIHVVILVVTGSMTLFHMSGTTYAPSYSVDLVSLPAPKPAPAAKPVPVVKPTPEKVKTPPKPAAERKVPKPVVSSPPVETIEKMKPSGGDEAARIERRRKIENLEMEARRLYESFTTEKEAPTAESSQPADETVGDTPVAGTPGAGNSAQANNIRFKAYYNRIWEKIRSSWTPVLPEGVTAQVSLVTVVGIRIAANGEIEQSWIEKKSGNDYYDESALRAVRKANPLPSLPDDLSETPLEVGINFRYPE